MRFKNLWALSIVFTMLISCETDDVPAPPSDGPEVKLSLSSQVIVEDGGTSDVVATLSESSSSDITVVLNFGGTASKNTDYNISAEEIIIKAGDITNLVDGNVY